MKILALTNLYPPHIIDPSDVRVQTVCDAFRQRGHKVRVITSNRGMGREYDDGSVARTLRLNGVYDRPLVTEIDELQPIEHHNNDALGQLIHDFEPDLIHIWSLHGLGKSLLLQVAESGIPFAVDVADPWLRHEFPRDPWLVYWNSGSVSFAKKMLRMGHTIAGTGKKIPTAAFRGRKEIKNLFDADGKATNTGAFILPRVYFCTEPLKVTAAAEGFNVDHAEIIPSAISAAHFSGAPLPADQAAGKFLFVSELNESSRIMEVLDALNALLNAGHKATLTIYGQGDTDFVAKVRNRILAEKLPVELRKVLNPTNELPKIHREHHAFIYATANAEPWSPAPLQAMASGLPVIINRAFEMQRFYVHRRNCLVYDSDDIGLLAGRMLELMQDGEARHELAATGQAEVLKAFDENTMIENITNFLQHTVDYWDDHKSAIEGVA
jgi:glycosyltransferase involved in cell wall biosynthesis